MRLAAPLALALCLQASSGLADGHFWGQWQHGPHEFSEYASWVSEIDPASGLVTATVHCAADTPYLSVAWTQGEMAQAEGQMQITVDGRPFWLNARYLFHAAEPAWSVVLLDDVRAALQSGSGATFEVATAGRGPATVRLNGSNAAISAALAGCGEGAGYNASNVNFFAFFAPDAAGTLQPVARLPEPGAIAPNPTTASEIASATPVAEGVPITPAEIQTRWASDCPSGVTTTREAFHTADLDLDGLPDLIVDYGALRCEGAEFASSIRGLGFCGMHNCSVDIYLSSIYAPGDWPGVVLNHMEVPPEIVGTPEGASLRTHVQGGSCPFAEVCTGIWAWDGDELAFSD